MSERRSKEKSLLALRQTESCGHTSGAHHRSVLCQFGCGAFRTMSTGDPGGSPLMTATTAASPLPATGTPATASITHPATIPAAAAPWSHRSSNLASTHNDDDDEHGYRQHSSPSASAPTRDSHEEETRFVPDPFVVNIQRTLVTDDTGARYPISYQESAVRMSYAHAFEQPSPYPATPLVNALC